VTAWPVTLGRAFDCDVVIDDPHVAARHATIEAAEAAAPGEPPALQLRVGDTRNGVLLEEGRTLVAGEVAPLPARGEAWQIGATRLRVRLPGEPLEPERPLGLAATGARPSVTAACAVAVWALVLAEHGVDLDPGSTLSDWLLPLLAFPGAVVGWCLVWATASRLWQHRFEFWTHFAVVVKGLLGVLLVDLLLPVAAFSMSWEWLARVTPPVAVGVAAATLYRHGALALPLKRWVWRTLIVSGLAVAGLLVGVINVQRTDRVFSEPYLSTLAPPGLLLAPGVSVKTFVDESRGLKERVDGLAERSRH
jgi:hypothetical protein